MLPPWKEAPFIRLLLPLIAGIVWAYYIGISPATSAILLLSIVAALIALNYTTVRFRYAWSRAPGLLLNLALAVTGCLLTASKDSSEEAEQALALSRGGARILVDIREPPSEKSSTWKTLASIVVMQNDTQSLSPPVDIFLYFRKDSLLQPPTYGERLLFSKALNPIDNGYAGGSFDYKTYCRLKNIYFQAFLGSEEYLRVPAPTPQWTYSQVIRLRKWVIGTLKRFIPGDKECGLAQALLIGFRDDLDKALLQSYSNTGVVHVVAISGLHLGLIYAILKWLCLPFGKTKKGRWTTLVVVMTGLWTFSLLAGASPSVLRSAVMFSFVVLGDTVSRRTFMVNSLAASAFLLLCFNPFWLWDLGFQLSYMALLSIVLFQKPVYNSLVVRYRFFDALWKLNAVTLSAQVLTTPVSVYHFRQFPNLFLLTNLFAVPLSSIILLGEILLCTVSALPLIAVPLGSLLSILIRLMNDAVEWFGALPFSTWQGLSIDVLQLAMLYLAIFSLRAWSILNQRAGLPLALAFTIAFLGIRLYKIWP